MTFQGTQINHLLLSIHKGPPLHYGLEAQTHRRVRCTHLSRRPRCRIVTDTTLFKLRGPPATLLSRAQVFSRPEVPTRPLPSPWLKPPLVMQVHTFIHHIC
jgi:hypothetical protein